MYDVIVNPASRSGRGARIWGDLEKELRFKQVEYRVYFTKSTRSIQQIIPELLKKREELNLVVLGGDGTLNQVINSIPMEDFVRVRIGYIPSGSSNDFARDLELSTDPMYLLKQILEGEVKRIYDLGVVEYLDETKENFIPTRKFHVSAGIGFDAAVCEEAMASKVKNILNKLGMGKLTYLFIALKQILTSKNPACELWVDGELQSSMENCLFIAAMNHRYEGGGFAFAPKAVATDGILDICAAGNISKLKFLFALPKALKGTHFSVSGIEDCYGREIEIIAKEPMWVHTDGEVERKSDHIRIRCVRQQLQFLD